MLFRSKLKYHWCGVQEEETVRKEKRLKFNHFVDDIADVQDDDDEDIEEEEDEPGARFIDEAEDDGKAVDKNRRLDARRRELARHDEDDDKHMEAYINRLEQQPIYEVCGELDLFLHYYYASQSRLFTQS